MAEHKNTFDTMVDRLMEDAVNAVIEEEGAALEMPDEAIVPSERHMAEMKKILKSEKQATRKKGFTRYSRLVASILVLFVAVTGITIFSVDAWRTKVIRFFLEIGAKNTDYNYSENKNHTYADENISLKYVPDGFELTEKYQDKKLLFWRFTRSEDFFQINICTDNATFNTDTEDGYAEQTQINGMDAIYLSNSNVNCLQWHNNAYLYRISGNISKEELCKIAENLKQ